jgi:hypothetical protein
MQSGDKKAVAGLVLSLAAGGIYMTGPLAFPHVSSEIWRGFFWLMVVIMAASAVYFGLIHTIREDSAMPISLMVVGAIMFFAGAVWLGIVNDRAVVRQAVNPQSAPEVAPNVVLLPIPERLQLNNNGSFEILLWGDKLEGYPASIEKEGRHIPPGIITFLN